MKVICDRQTRDQSDNRLLITGYFEPANLFLDS